MADEKINNKVLLVYFSRSGHIERLANMIQEQLKEYGVELLKLETDENFKGFLGYMRAGKAAWFQKGAKTQEVDMDFQRFKLCVIGSPVHSWDVSAPVRGFLESHGKQLEKIACFSTMGGSGDPKLRASIETLCDKKLITFMAFLDKHVDKQAEVDSQMKPFIEAIKAALD